MLVFRFFSFSDHLIRRKRNEFREKKVVILPNYFFYVFHFTLLIEDTHLAGLSLPLSFYEGKWAGLAGLRFWSFHV